MRVLSIDYGLKRIGLAQSDPTGLLAQGLGVLQRVSDKHAIEDIAKIVQENEVGEVVVGLPKNMNGSIGQRAEQCMTFADKLSEAVPVPVVMYDERLTTVAATRVLIDADMRRNKRKRVVDEIAATILLQNYLDYKRSTKA